MLDVDTDAVRGAQLWLRQAEKPIRAGVARETRARLNPLWRKLVAQRRARDPWMASHVARTGAGVGMTQGGNGVLRWRVQPLSGGYGDSIGESRTLDYGSRGRYAVTGQLPRHYGPEGAVDGAIKQWVPAAARVWLATIAETVRDGLGE